MTNKYKEISELLKDHSLEVTSSNKEWFLFLDTASWLFKYSFEDQILIHGQKPDARACAEFEVWNTRLNRWIKKGSKGIALLDDSEGIRYVFDITDTVGRNNQQLYLWEVSSEYHETLIENIEERYDKINHPISFGEALLDVAKIVVEYHIDDYLLSLLKYHSNSNLEELNDFEIRKSFTKLLEGSVGYAILNRCGEKPFDYIDEDDFYFIKNFNTLETVGLLGTAYRDICEIAMDDIAKDVRSLMARTFEKRKTVRQNKVEQNERSGLNEENHILISRGLSDTQSKSSIKTAKQQIRSNETELFKEQSFRLSVLAESEQQVKRTFANDRRTGELDVGKTSESNVREDAGTRQREESDGMGQTYEYTQNAGGGDSDSRSNLQLDLNLEENDKGGMETLESSLPPFDLVDLPELLRADLSLNHTKEEIIKYFNEHTDDNERAVYLDSCYDETLVQVFRNILLHDYTYIGYRRDETGLDVWQGNYLNPHTKSHFTFDYLQHEVAKLIENNEYLENPLKYASRVLQEYQMNSIGYYTRRVIFTHHDRLNFSTPEVISFFKEQHTEDEQIQFVKALYNDEPTDFIVDEVHLGYAKQSSGLLLYYGNYEDREEEQLEPWSNIAYFIDGLVLARYYDTKIQIPTVEEQKYAVYKNEDDFKNNYYFSQEEIDRIIVRGSGVVDGKFRIYEKFLEDDTIENRAKFLKKEYGTGGSYPIIGGAHIGENHSSKGITLTKGDNIDPDVKITLSWKKIAKRIDELISLDRYMSSSEKDEYGKYLQSKINEELVKEQEKVKISNPANRRYVYSMGDTFYKGIDEFQIIDIAGDNIDVQDKQFPLFFESYSRSDFDELLKENPLNDKLLQYVDEVIEPVRNQSLEKLYTDSLSVLVDKIKESKIYTELHDRDTSIEDAEVMVRSELFSIVASMNTQNRDLYLAYNESSSFKENMINDIIDRTYQDLSKGYDNSDNLIKDVDKLNEYNDLYEHFKVFGNHILKHQSCLMIFNSSEKDDSLMITNHNDEPDKIKMFHYYQDGEIERNDPYMEFIIDRNEKELHPIYYRHDHPYLELSVNTESSILSNVEIQNELNRYASQWFKNLNDMNYRLTSQQLYKDENRQEIYNIEIREGVIEYCDMPDNVLEEYARESGLTISNKLLTNSKIVKIDIKEFPAERLNYRITDEHLGSGTPKVRYKNNVAAIKLLFLLEKENRLANSSEQEILAKYVGWGGLSDAFDETKSTWSNEYHELKNLLSEDEYASARESTLTAFYTSPVVIDGIYKALEQMGFKHGNILEPSCGTGNFIGMLPESMNTSKIYGIELDSISGRIAKQLYQNSSIAVEGYENTNLPDSFFDVAIGNVPFGQFRVLDRQYDKYNFSIHDYFFAKTIDKVRPGGIIAFITSRFTMDKANSTVRKYINERTEFIGAIRLPNNAFLESAGTKIVSDIIFLQKRERSMIVDNEWLNIEKDTDGNIINSYFITHPEMILGRIEKTMGQYGYEDLTVVPNEDIRLKDALYKTIGYLNANITEHQFVDEIEIDEDLTIPADPEVRNYSYTLVDDEIYYRENSIMVKPELALTVQNRVKGMVNIRNCVRKLIRLQSEDFPDGSIKEEQVSLNNLYDDFSSKYGLINSRSNRLAFRDDSSYYLLCSLENLNEDGTLNSKADMFTKRTIRNQKKITSVDTANEALLLSLAEKGKIDFDFMEQLSSKSQDEIISDLKGVIYEVPDLLNSNKPSKYVTADEYLSGNIRDKLQIARMASSLDNKYQFNVGALERAMPKELSASEIEVRLGATWVPAEIYEQFMFEILETSSFNQNYVSLNFVSVTGNWNVKNKSFDRGNIKSERTYGTSRVNAYKLLEDCLNLKTTKIYDIEYDNEGNKTSVLNRRETMLAQQKQDLIKETFKDWIWKDIDRRELLIRIYNEMFNSIRPREYNGDHLEFPGMNPEIILRKHQKDAVAHILYGNNVLLAHVVGAGKTFTMVAAAMELKRLGLTQKSMFVVPNHLVEQWASEFLQLYPSANILVTRKQDFEKNNRKRFCSRITTGDYDAVIIGHSQFEKIPVSIKRQKRMLNEQIESITKGIRDLKNNHGERFSIKQLEKTKKSLKIKLEKLNKNDHKDDIISFEELGVDRIFVDEAHFYKNLFLFTKMRNISGLATTEAQKSSDLFMKCQYLDEVTDGKGIVFATGTPLSNSMTEMYTMQRYLQNSTIKKHGLEHFDSWASTFGETVSAIELAPTGNKYRMKTRFARFYNLPELISMFKEVADIKTSDMLDLPLPVANFHNISTKPSEIQKEIVESLGERAEIIHEGGIDPTEDNMLKVTNDGRKLALDQRLINPLLPANENSKVNSCIDNVFEIWNKTSDSKSTQMIFCDMSVPKADTFNVYDEIKNILIKKGVPESEIAYIHNANSDAKKKELFSKVRSGKVRILIGSTQKMGAGTNVQNLLIATHDLDCPWRPSDLEQRAGRIIRQGNSNKEVHIYRYVTEGTFDAYLYQLVENKQKFISQIITSKSPVRSAEDIDEASLNYAEIKALASGNPKIKEKMDLDMRVNKLKLAKASYLSQKYELEDRIVKYYPQKISSIKERIISLEKDISEILVNDGFLGMEINGIQYSDKEQAGNALLLACKSLKGNEETYIGKYNSFQLYIEYDSLFNCHKLQMKNHLTHIINMGSDVYGNIVRMDNLINSLPNKLISEKQILVENQHQLENAKEEVNKSFDKDEELQEALERLSVLDKELDIGKADIDIIDVPEDKELEKKDVLSR